MKYNAILPPILSIFGLGLLSCAPAATGEEDAEVRSVSEALAVYPNFSVWTSPQVVNVCFMLPANESWNSNDDLRSQQALDTLNTTWGSATGLSFQRLVPTHCTASTPTGLNLLLRHNDGWGGQCGPGVGTTCDFGSADFINENRFRGVVSHEVGHALGFAHEHTRANTAGTSWEVPLCTSVAGDPYNGNNIYNSSLRKVTGYDPISVMNYCGIDNGRATEGSDGTPISTWDLSWLDLVGAEANYPKSLTQNRFGCRSACFETDFGVVTADYGSVSTSLLARGALASSSLGNVTWKISGKADRTEVNLYLANVASEATTTVNYSFTDFQGRSINNSTGPNKVLKSAGYFASIVGVAVPLM